ncbi:hypothetical protein SAMN05216261_1408 [Algibacter luteus]|uniref:Uncharacterized protein n=1 Tax=Algibacter luteus TaxID=1178825 RepID=A0A1M6D7Y6_9FLAO|nr:hypothetical protein SAMN05216261_1408 [Algibacter luteus]
MSKKQESHKFEFGIQFEVITNVYKLAARVRDRSGMLF